MSFRKLPMFAALFLCSALVMAQPTIVGEHVPADVETQHPYSSARSSEPVMVQSDVVTYPAATYIALHFERFDLAPDDFVIVRTPDYQQVYEYTGKGRMDLGVHPNGFFATHLKGDTAIVELWSMGASEYYGYSIDFFGRGYNKVEIQQFWNDGLGELMNLPEPHEHGDDGRSICTTDDSREAKCYQVSDPDAYDTSRAVCRLLLNGNAHCTGWLIGQEGHVMTNEHCIGSQAQANNIDFEFMAEGADCSTNCASSVACSNGIQASGSQLIAFDAPLDYALVLPNNPTVNLVDTYGFMRLRPTGAVVGERLYIPQHPAGWGKRIAMESTYPEEPPGGFATVASITEAGCSGGGAPDDVGYWADTQGGSSGSAVLGYSDNLVIALHHCRGAGSCASGGPGDDPNRGVPIQEVIAHLGANLPLGSVCTPPDVPGGVAATANGDNQIDVSWSAVAGADSYNVYRAQGDCPQSSYELLASGVTSTTYSDTTVSGNIAYSYTISAFVNADNCESLKSDCSSATTTGLCIIPPEFGGAISAFPGQDETCVINLTWAGGSVFCSGSLVYNIYRSTDANFTPGPDNLLVSCVKGTSYQDFNVVQDTLYHYIVRAEDATSNGSGPCNSGLTDSNNQVVTAMAVRDLAVLSDDLESGTANWSVAAGPLDPGGTASFELVSDNSFSPVHSWFVADEPTTKDQVLETANGIAVPNASGITLSFQHQVDTEATWDGGVLEYSLDGTNWVDILSGSGAVPANANRFLSNGYVGALSGGPLSGRQSWNGNLYSGDWARVIVDLDDFAGQTVWLRWRLSCDGSVASQGWWIDDVRLGYFGPCFDATPEWNLEMWLSDALYHPFYDSNGNGYIDVADVILQNDQQP